MEQLSKMVKGTLYKKAPTRANKQATSADMVRENMVVERIYADYINKQNEEDPRYIQEFIIDEEATAQWVIDNKKDYEERKEKEKFQSLDKDDIVKSLIGLASKGNSENDEEKPKKTRRTKAQIESDENK